mmetsp:Transcript_38296/g.82848  ORF Transcript_38296/g.82848 Transcript_38296/m.82848 type:complete len:213 (+) Transcript_38296:685-1323(+)
MPLEDITSTGWLDDPLMPSMYMGEHSLPVSAPQTMSAMKPKRFGKRMVSISTRTVQSKFSYLLSANTTCQTRSTRAAPPASSPLSSLPGSPGGGALEKTMCASQAKTPTFLSSWADSKAISEVPGAKDVMQKKVVGPVLSVSFAASSKKLPAPPPLSEIMVGDASVGARRASARRLASAKPRWERRFMLERNMCVVSVCLCAYVCGYIYLRS